MCNVLLAGTLFVLSGEEWIVELLDCITKLSTDLQVKNFFDI